MEINKKNGTHHAVKFNLTVVSEEVAWSLLAGWAWKVNNLLSAELQSYDTETPVYCSTSSPYIVKPSQWGPRYKDCSLSSIVQHGAPPETSPAADLSSSPSALAHAPVICTPTPNRTASDSRLRRKMCPVYATACGRKLGRVSRLRRGISPELRK